MLVCVAGLDLGAEVLTAALGLVLLKLRPWIEVDLRVCMTRLDALLDLADCDSVIYPKRDCLPGRHSGGTIFRYLEMRVVASVFCCKNFNRYNYKTVVTIILLTV